MNNNLKLLIWNARGLRNKTLEFFDFLIRENVDIGLVSETGLNNKITMYHPDFHCYRKDREHSRGGGVAIVIRKNIKHNLLPTVNTELIENVGIKVSFNDDTNVNIFSCYFPGGSSDRNGIKKALFKSDLKKFSRLNEDYILGGDFNCRNQSWGCLRANTWGNILYELITTNNFGIIYPAEPTLIPANSRSNPSVLDMFITNVPNKLSAAIVLNNLSSDHLPVYCTYNSCCITTENLKYDYKRANWNTFKRFLNNNINNLLDASINNCDDIERLIIDFIKLLHDAIDSSIPKKVISNFFIT